LLFFDLDLHRFGVLEEVGYGAEFAGQREIDDRDANDGRQSERYKS
jgi:hypothetical protein